ncbi:MAG: ABATE domain-containing protein [Chloroflexi bacterium]|nr:ABATE domain-containing protein [Chloroflexota bacterium]
MNGSDYQDFSFIGGWLCLDFANTADGDINTDWTERLESYPHLVAWAQQAGALDDETAERLAQQAAQQPVAAAGALEQARRLRLTIYRIFSTIADERTPDAAELAAFNTALAAAMEHMQVQPRGDGFAWAWAGDSLERPLWPVVWSAAELLLSPEHHMVRECGGRDCSWLFVDTSRNHSRRWCDMKSCGNREKARSHYRRSKGDRV